MNKKAFALGLLMLLVLQGIADAREIRCRVIRKDTESGKLTISYLDPISESWKMSDILVRPETMITGAQSFSDLIPGQAILVDVSDDEANGLIANAIQVPPASEVTQEAY